MNAEPTAETPTEVLELEQAGCRTWHLTPSSYGLIDHDIDEYGVFAKAYTAAGDDGRLETIGLRIGSRPGHVIAFYGDWIIRHPDGGFTVHKAPAEADR